MTVFIGWAIGCIVIPPFADRHGRKVPFLVGVYLQASAWLLIMFTHNFGLFLVLCFIFGFGIAGRYTIGFVFCVEQMPKAFRVQIGMLINLADAAVILYITIYLSIQ